MSYYDEYELNPNKPLVLFLNDIPSAVMDYVKVSNQQYKSKILKNSSSNNWLKTLELFNDYNISSVICKVTIGFLLRIALSEFHDIRTSLFEKIAEYPNQFFIYEENLFDIKKIRLYNFDLLDLLDEEERKYFYNLPVLEQNGFYYIKNKEKIEEVYQLLKDGINFLKENKNIELIPYTSNAELSMLTTAFLENVNKKIIFKLYIPNERIWSEPQGKIIHLFKDYLNSLFKSNIQLTEKRNKYGNIYELYGEISSEINLNDEFNEFAKFLNSFSEGISYAKNILETTGLSHLEIERLLNRYSKEARRMLLDIKQESEEKILRLRHRLENEVDELDMELSESNRNTVNNFLKNINVSNNFTSIINPEISLLGNGNHDIKLQNSQIFQIINSSVSEIILGNQKINPDLSDLHKIIEQYGKEKTNELSSALAEVQDDSLPIAERKTAASKLKSFLLTKIADPILQESIPKLVEKLFALLN